MSTGPDEEDEEQQSTASVARKAWFAGHQSVGDSTESAGFRGVPGVPHGGSKTVTRENTAGSMDLCWCGRPFDHDWAGKAGGRPHPRKEDPLIKEEADMPTPAAEPEEQPRIERRALRAYHSDLADLILTAVNEYHIRYRLTAHSVILFPPDGTTPYAVNARNGDKQVKPARLWFARHCLPQDKPIKTAASKKAVSQRPVDEATVKELAEALNGPEHIHEDPEPEKQKPAMVATTKAAEEPVHPVVEEPTAADFSGVQGVQDSDVAAAEEWMPYIRSKSKDAHPHMLINAEGKVKCKLCGDILPGRKSVAGHLRTHHSDTTTLWGPQAKQKATETYRTTKLSQKVQTAIEQLQEAIGVTPQHADVEALQKELNKVKANLDKVTAERDKAIKERDEAQAKLDIIREGLAL